MCNTARNNILLNTHMVRIFEYIFQLSLTHVCNLSKEIYSDIFSIVVINIIRHGYYGI